MKDDDLLILSFEDARALHAWLVENHASSSGIWLRIYRKGGKLPSVSFLEVLDEGLCFGWSESQRRPYDQTSYLQRFSPRSTPGTQSRRNLERAQALIRAGRMTPAGLRALGMEG